MDLTKRDAASIQGGEIEAVVDWFEEHKEYYYTLGWYYLQNQQQLVELFYRSISKVHKELPRYKGNPPFEKWVTLIFIDQCRELSRSQSVQAPEPRHGIFGALDQLENDKKEALILTYAAGFPREEAAQILGVSAEKMKNLLFSAIQSVRERLHGIAEPGCEEYHKHYIDYLEKSMDRNEKIEFEIHLYNCPSCQADLASFQEVAATKLKPVEKADSFFMEKVKKKLFEKKQHSQQKNKKRKKAALICTSAVTFVLAIGFFTGVFAKYYYAWTEEDEQLRALLQENLGQRVSLEAESDGVKVKIKGVVADEIQTLVFYEIQDTKKDQQYFMVYEDGVMVEDENKFMDTRKYPRYTFPDIEAEMNKKAKNVFYGHVSLRPIEKENERIKLKITKLQKLASNAEGMYEFRTDEFITGEWNFEIPVKKQPLTEYALDEKIEIEGIPLRFEKVTIAPTTTILQYAISSQDRQKQITYLNFKELEVNNRKGKADRFGSIFMDEQQGDGEWSSFEASFDPLYRVKPKELNIRMESVYLSFEEHMRIELEGNQYPRTFEYAGSTISIDKIEKGKSTKYIISNDDLDNRTYESLYLDLLDENKNYPEQMHVEAKGVLIDKNGVEYDLNIDPLIYEKIEQPRYFITEQIMNIEDNTQKPKSLQISGYNTMKYLNKTLKLRVKK